MDQRPIILVTQLLRCDAVEVFIDVKNVFCFSLILATFLHFLTFLTSSFFSL